MRHILEFNEYKDDSNQGSTNYKVISWNKGGKEDEFISGAEEEKGYSSQTHVNLKEEDSEMDYFNVTVEDGSGKHDIVVEYQMFLEFIESEMPNLKSYLDNADFNNIDEIFDDLEELGVNLGELIQKYVDKHVTSETIDANNEDEDDNGMFVDEDGDMYNDFDGEDDENIEFDDQDGEEF